MMILACDTSSASCSAALYEDGVILSSITINKDREHSKILMPMIEELYEKCDKDPSKTDILVSNIGPGSFTGLRIGLSVMKGMAKALNIPLYTYDTFKVQGESFSTFNGNILILNDALRKTFYSSLIKFKDNESTKLENDEVRTFEEIKELLKKYDEPILISGDALIKYGEEVNELFPHAIKAPFYNNLPSSESLISLALKSIKKNEPIDENPTPYYMRKPQAVREYEEKQNKQNEG